MQKVSSLVSKEIGNYLTNRATWSIVYVLSQYATGNGTTDDAGSINTLITSIGSDEATIVVDPGTYRCGSAVTVPSNITLWFLQGGILSPDSGDTITINGPIEAGVWKIFAGSGTIAGSPRVETLYPQWWGAVGDGTTSDTTAIQSALDISGGNQIVVIPNTSSNIYMTGTLSIPSDIKIIISDGVTLKLPNGANEPIIQNADIVNGNSNICIEGGILNSNQANQTANFSTIQLTKVTNSQFKNIEVNGSFTVGYIGVGAWDLYQCEKVLIENSKVYNSSDEGLYLRECDYCQVVGGEYYDNLFGSGVATDKGEHNRVLNVYCHGNGGSNFSINGLYSSVTNCISESCLAFNGITLGHTGSPASYSVVSGCLVKGNPNGIRVLASSSGVVVSNNIVIDNNATSGIGIGVSDSSFDCIIESNYCYNNYFGIYISTALKGNVVRGNIVKLSKVTGLTINASNNNVVEGNICENNATLGTGYGIYISTTSVDNIVTNNRCFDSQGTKTQQRGIYSDGTKNIISNNIVFGNSVVQLTAAAGNFLSNNVMSSTDAVRFDVTLSTGTSTVITNGNINTDSKISFIPKTSTAPAREAYQSAIANGSITLTHSSSGASDIISVSIN